MSKKLGERERRRRRSTQPDKRSATTASLGGPLRAYAREEEPPEEFSVSPRAKKIMEGIQKKIKSVGEKLTKAIRQKEAMYSKKLGPNIDKRSLAAKREDQVAVQRINRVIASIHEQYDPIIAKIDQLRDEKNSLENLLRLRQQQVKRGEL